MCISTYPLLIKINKKLNMFIIFTCFYIMITMYPATFKFKYAL